MPEIENIKILAPESDYERWQRIDARYQAYCLVDDIDKELDRFWIRNDVIHKKLMDINQYNAYSFIYYMMIVSKSQNALGDLNNLFTYLEIKNLVRCLLIQAEEYGLQKKHHFIILMQEYKSLLIKSKQHPTSRISKKLAKSINTKLENLYEEIYKAA